VTISPVHGPQASNIDRQILAEPTAAQMLAETRAPVEPVHRAAIDALPQELRNIAGYHAGTVPCGAPACPLAAAPGEQNPHVNAPARRPGTPATERAGHPHLLRHHSGTLSRILPPRPSGTASRPGGNREQQRIQGTRSLSSSRMSAPEHGRCGPCPWPSVESRR
jgi:hypothetical protein